jgi:hypothetical protein
MVGLALISPFRRPPHLSLERKEPRMMDQKTQILVQKMQARTAELHIAESALFAAALVGAAKKRDRLDPYDAVASASGASRSRIWSLVHRPRSLKSIASHIREGLANAYARECERQRKLLEHEIAIATAAGASPSLVSAASRLGGLDASEEAAQ